MNITKNWILDRITDTIDTISNVAPGELESTMFDVMGQLHKLYVQISKNDVVI